MAFASSLPRAIKHVPVVTPEEYKKYMTLNNFVNFELFFTKLSGVDPYEKHIDCPGGHAWEHVFMAWSKLEATGL